MKKILVSSETLINLFKKQKIAILQELQEVTDFQSRMNIFRKLKKIDYITSYSHGASFYSLNSIANFNELGLWFYKTAKFSKYGNLLKTVENIIGESEKGFSSSELEKVLDINADNTLRELARKEIIHREKFSGVYVYFSKQNRHKQKQILFRKDSISPIDEIIKPEILLNELKATLLLLFSALDEKQKRLYAGYESLKVGRGGDRRIAKLLDLNEQTVTRGRKELLSGDVELDRIRKKGGGRIGFKKKQKK